MTSREIVRSKSSALVAQTLPDGSAAIFDAATKNVYSLNPSAAAAWEACSSATTLSELAVAMSRRLNVPVTEDVAHEAVSELAAVGLVTVTPAEGRTTSRRELLKQVAEVAIPVVLVLTGTEQRAHAQVAGSPPPSTTPTPGTTPPPGTTPTPGTTICPPSTFTLFKGVISTPEDPSVTPLPGAKFDILNASNVLVAQLVTGLLGRASVDLPAGTYTLVETFAPGGPYVPFPPTPFTLLPCQDLVMDRRNVLA